MATIDMKIEREIVEEYDNSNAIKTYDTHRKGREFHVNASVEEIQNEFRQGRIYVTIEGYRIKGMSKIDMKEETHRITCPNFCYEENKACIEGCISEGARIKFCSSNYEQCPTYNPLRAHPEVFGDGKKGVFKPY